MSEFKIGDRVVWRNVYGGVVRFIPATVTRVGKNISIQLDENYPDGTPQYTFARRENISLANVEVREVGT